MSVEKINIYSIIDDKYKEISSGNSPKDKFMKEFIDNNWKSIVDAMAEQMCEMAESAFCAQEEAEEGKCYDGEKCQPDEFGCCIVCCECKSCIKRLEEEEVKCFGCGHSDWRCRCGGGMIQCVRQR